MLCPACKNDMIVVEYHQTELDYCTGCKGVWFDNVEMDLMLKSLGLEKPELLLENLLHNPEADTAEKKRKCPICGKTMKMINVGDKTNVIIDICPSGDGLWFDSGEVVQMVRQLAAEHRAEGDEERVFNFLREVFQG
jgi:Zn-finger nucleic acid-binding protein